MTADTRMSGSSVWVFFYAQCSLLLKCVCRALLTYDDNSIILDSTGIDYDEFVSKFSGEITSYYNAGQNVCLSAARTRALTPLVSTGPDGVRPLPRLPPPLPHPSNTLKGRSHCVRRRMWSYNVVRPRTLSHDAVRRRTTTYVSCMSK